MIKIDLSRYKPLPVNLRKEDILTARSRLTAYVQDQWWDLDTRPRSPFGDLVLTPAAYMESAVSRAAERVLNDMDPNVILNGAYLNQEVAGLVVRMLGYTPVESLPGYGMVDITFRSPVRTVIDAPFSVYNGSWSAYSVDEGTSRNGQLVINPPADRVVANGYHMVQGSDGKFHLYLTMLTTMSGAPGSGTELEIDEATMENIRSVKVYKTFSNIMAADTLPVAMRRLNKSFAKPGFSSRANIESYLMRCYPEVKEARVFLSTDPEMTRRYENLLGLRTPDVDVVVWPRSGLQWRQDSVPVRYNREHNMWIGSVYSPMGICLIDRESLFTLNKFSNDRRQVRVYSGSAYKDNLPEQVSYSLGERIAVELSDFSPVDFSASQVSVTHDPADTERYNVTVTGEYCGDLFSGIYARLMTCTIHTKKDMYFDIEDRLADLNISFVGDHKKETAEKIKAYLTNFKKDVDAHGNPTAFARVYNRDKVEGYIDRYLHQLEYVIADRGVDLIALAEARRLVQTYREENPKVRYSCLLATVRDELSGESGNLIFKSDVAESATNSDYICNGNLKGAEFSQYRADYRRMLGGLDLHLHITNPDQFDLVRFKLMCSAKVALMNISYAYNDAVYVASTRSSEIATVGSEKFLVRSFCVSEVTQLELNLSAYAGQKVDTTGVKDATVNYINSITHPDRYQESDVFRVISKYGVEGIDSVNPVIIHHTTPADYYIDGETVIDTDKNISRGFLDVPEAVGHSKRNHKFYLSSGRIKVNIRRVNR